MAISQPSVADTKAIAEEGYIYGLPIVMNYAVMYAYSVDHTSPEFKAPFNKIKNEARVFTDKDTAIVTPNSCAFRTMADSDSGVMADSIPAA